MSRTITPTRAPRDARYLQLELAEIRGDAAWIRNWRRNATTVIDLEGIEAALDDWRIRVGNWRRYHAELVASKIEKYSAISPAAADRARRRRPG